MDNSNKNRFVFDARDKMLASPDSHMSGFDLWDPAIFSELDLQYLRNPSIESRLADPQDIQELAASAQEPLPSLANQDLTVESDRNLTTQHAYAVLHFEEPNISTNGFQREHVPQGDNIHIENEALAHMLHNMKLELSAVKEDLRQANLKLITVNDNHKKLVIWTVNMNSGLNAISRWLSENVGADVVILEDVGLSVDDNSF